jgi:membrane-bound lytic murein transglycosylase D
VLRQLNLLLGTPDGRAFLTSDVARMHDFQAGILPELKWHALPTELLAVPLVESGYRNLAPKIGPGAGLWMFVVPTARGNGLEVSADRDERRRFPDWPAMILILANPRLLR